MGKEVGAGQHRALQLFGCWDLRIAGRSVRIGRREQRLVAYLALNGRRMRSYVAGMLWPDSTESHAQSNLRAALLKIRRAAPGLVEADQMTVALAGDVHIDVHEFRQCTSAVAANPDEVDFRAAMYVLTGPELTPGWYEDWVTFEREQLQHERVRALEALAIAELRRSRGDAALTAVKAASAVEPLRESAHAIAIRAHLILGNVADAFQEYEAYARLLRHELGISPSDQLRELLTPSAQAV